MSVRMSNSIAIPYPRTDNGYQNYRVIKVVRSGSDPQLSVDEEIMLAQHAELASLKEQNAMLTLQVQQLDGWKLVPMEPTKEMIEAACAHYVTNEYTGVSSMYKAMLVASPAIFAQEPKE